MPGGTTSLAVAFEDIRRSATRRTVDAGAESRPLSAWSDLGAFVLLAEPGGGKSWAFEFEAKASRGVFVKARTLANLGAPPGWQGETLFIDGFDEMRADAASRFGPLDTLIQRLNELGRPRFRLSCREADWLATVDSEALREVAPGKQLDALYLDPLTDPEVAELLRRRSGRIPDPDRFREQAKIRGLDGLLRNPLLLELLVDAVGDAWPRGRADVYDLACKRMADEHNPAFRAARALKASLIDQVLHDAGLLCAVLLLSGSDALIDGVSADKNAELSIRALPSTLGVKDADAALSTKLFVAEGLRRLPRHRSVAEYLAARAIGRQVTIGGLPVSRVLALMSGYDGGIVEPLRGLSAWLAVTCRPQRAVLIERDPLACVLYGDVHAFDADDKRRVLDGLRREAERFVWFRQGNWAAHPFGALATADMADEFAARLKSADRSPAHQSLLGCVLDAICYGEPMPGLLALLESVVRDATFRDDVRSSALEAWLAQSGSNLSRARVWLDEIRSGAIDDLRDELCGRLLDALYPQWLAPAEVMAYLHVSKMHNFVGNYRHFWSAQLIRRTPAAARPFLADGLVAIGIPKDALHAHFELPQIIASVIAAALDAQASPVNVERLATWLAVGLDEYGFAVLNGDDSLEIREWLEQHSEVQKALVAHEYARLRPDPQSRRFHFWSCEEILYRARRPRDWYRWLLAHAAQAESSALVEHCFLEAAHAVLRETPEFGIEMEAVERWVEGHRNQWPQADQWLEQAWSLPLDHYLGKQHHRQREHALQQATEREQRRAGRIEHLTDIESGRASHHRMYEVALAYRGHFTNIRGETPEARVRELLGGDADEAARAIDGLEATLARDDLPSVGDILALNLEQRHHYIRPACLLGAELACARDLSAPLAWSDELVRRLIAFRLTDGTGGDPAWYKLLLQHRPHVVAQVLGDFARQGLLRRVEHLSTGLWSLARDESQAELVSCPANT